jgi:hypothetical protein
MFIFPGSNNNELNNFVSQKVLILDAALHASADRKYRHKKEPWASGKSNDWCKQGGCAHSGDVTERSHFKSAERWADQIVTRAF